MQSKYILFFITCLLTPVGLSAQGPQSVGQAAHEQNALFPLIKKTEMQLASKEADHVHQVLAKKLSSLERYYLAAKGTTAGLVSLGCCLVCTVAGATKAKDFLLSPELKTKFGFFVAEALLALATLSSYQYSIESFKQSMR